MLSSLNTQGIVAMHPPKTLACGWLFIVLLAHSAWGDPPRQPWFPQAPPLDPPTGQVIRVATVPELFAAADQVPAGGTILLADGVYDMPRYFELHTDDVTLRSESGQRDRVVLDEPTASTGTRGDLALLGHHDRRPDDPEHQVERIQDQFDKHATRVTIRNCVIHNIWQRGVKGPAVGQSDRGKVWPTDCRIEYCLFYNDRPKQYADDPADTPDTFGGNYVGGIDAMHAKGWLIRDNVFVGIHGRTGEGRGAIFLWTNRRTALSSATSSSTVTAASVWGTPIAMPTRVARQPLHRAEQLRDRCAETGMLAAHTRDCLVVHNTVHDRPVGCGGWSGSRTTTTGSWSPTIC